MDTMHLLGYLLIVYLLGSIPTGLLVGRGFYNIDIRQYGSKNIGATNTYRVLGLPAALLVFLGDALKGIVAVYLFEPLEFPMVLGGLVALLGHNWSIFLGFKGGRGVATGLGVLIGLAPVVSLICFSIWAFIVYFTKLVSLGSIVAAFFVPVLMFAFNLPVSFIVFGVIAAFFVIFRHRENIRRLLTGTELKVERTKK